MADGQRIGVLALGRPADVLTAAPIVDGLSRRRSVRSVEVIHFIDGGDAARRLAGASGCHAVPPVQADIAPRQLRERIAAIRGEGFDVVVHLSQGRLAASLAPMLAGASAEIRGTWLDVAGRMHRTHPSLDHLAHWGADPDLGVFAHRDLWAMAARVRIGTDHGLRPDPVADSIVDHEQGGTLKAPIVCHASGLGLPGAWRETSQHRWRALLLTLRKRTGHPVVLLGAPQDAPGLEGLAASAGVRLCAWPLRFAAALLRRCAGLITVDREPAVLASAMGSRAVVLRTGSQRGVASLPGSGALIVDGAERASVNDVAALTLQHFKLHELSATKAASLAKNLVIRQTQRDQDGLLGARCPKWLPARPEQHRRDADEAAWRKVWRHSFEGDPIPADLLRRLCNPKSDIEANRLELALRSNTPVGQALRDVVRIAA